MAKELNKKNNKRLIALICTSFGCLIVFCVILLMVHFNMFPKSNSNHEEFVDNIFYMNYDVFSLDDSVKTKLLR